MEYFVAVADELNFSRAAHQVHVVQSALSTSVAKLEKELGVALFDRTRQQIRLTPAGEIFRDNASRVINTARQARDSIGDYQGQLSGTIEFGSIVSFGTLQVPRVLGSFTAPILVFESNCGWANLRRRPTCPQLSTAHWIWRSSQRRISFPPM